MTDTRVADVLDALYDLIVAQTDIAAAITAGTLKAFDGPPTTDFSAATMLVIGGAPFADEIETPETSVSWDWAAMGRSGAFADIAEWIDVPCAIQTRGGATDMRALRRTAITFYAKAATAIRGSTLSIGEVMWCTCAVSGIRQEQTHSGAECLVTFVARARTQI
jgi:hypothetical protein